MHYLLFNKPFGVICQFTKHPVHPSLADFNFPKDVYPVGRLDTDSEGLLIFTDDGDFQHRLIHPKFNHARTYWAQVENIPTPESLKKLEKGVLLDGELTKPAKIRLIDEPKNLWERSVPIRFRKNIPTAWVELTLTEGRNRQVRRMTAAIGHPTLRLIRSKIETWDLGELKPGAWKKFIPINIRPVK